ncbi:hypothetical protein [Actinophytocola sp.]|uniref:hypothetical protein n=1 Tax=Actinophytocola sp. TaxID=1872138 RepID=UPI002ED02B28
MSASSERDALDRPVSLFEHAQRLHRSYPDEPFPDDGRPLPGEADQPHVPHEERRLGLLAALREFIGDPTLSAQDLHDQCAMTSFRPGDIPSVLRKLAPEPSQRLLRTARWLIRDGTDLRAVAVGLGLLRGNAERRDVAALRIIGRLRCVERLAVEALAAIPGAERDLVWLAERAGLFARIRVVETLVDSDDPAVRDWVRSTPRDLLSSDLARRIAERHGLAELLHESVVTDAVWDQAGNLLLAMTDTRDNQSEIGRYEAAVTVYERWVALADRRPATLERAALLAMVAEDLRTGPAAPVARGLRGPLVDQIERVLSTRSWVEMLADSAGSDDPVTVRRAEWLMREVARDNAPRGRFAVRIVVPEPNPGGFPRVEARIVIDGIPVVAAAFDRGPADSPQRLLHSGRLRATSEPREIKLAEAYCTEGCCGGLYVTIVREGSEVVWKDWRSSTPGEPPQEMRFDAAEYDREVTRAERDRSWE